MLSALFATASAGSLWGPAAGEVVSVAVLVYVLYRQRQVRALRTAFVLPLVLAAVGLLNVVSDVRVHPLSLGQVAVLVAVFAGDSIGLGAARACTVRLWHQDGRVVRQGSWLTVGLWLAGVAVHESVLAVARMDSSSLLLYLGFTLAAQRLVLAARAARAGPRASGRAGGNGRPADDRA